MDEPPTQRRRWPRAVGLVVVLFVGLQCVGFRIPGLDVLFHLVVGWVAFLVRVLPRVGVRWDLVGSTAVYAALLVVGSHGFLRWLYREVRRNDADAGREPTAAAVWPWRSTLGGFALVLLMFVSGTAAVGVAHQAAWLARSPRPVYTSERPANRIKCASNLRQVGMALLVYAQANGGKYPDRLAPLIADGELDARVVLCPSSDDVPAPGRTPAEQAANLSTPGHCSYIYFGRGLTTALAGADRVIAVERIEHHDGEGLNVLYADAHVEWVPLGRADRLLTGLGFERVEAGPHGTTPTR